jgi:aminoglycoside phosphotransferase (APT) family kinase protein
VSAPSQAEAQAALSRFAASGRLLSLEPFPRGLINHSWVARLEGRDGERRYLLQQINRHVFRRPEHVIENMQRITRHLAARIARGGEGDPRRSVQELVETRDGRPAYLDERGETWRLVPWIEGTRALDSATSETFAYEAARAFGRFERLLADLEPPPLHATIQGFHDTPARVAAFERVVREDRVGRAALTRDALEAVLDRRALAAALADPAARGEIRERPVHNDSKIANVLFDEANGEALCVVDLDTTMPGYAAHDFGDLVRSAVSESAEDETELGRIRLRTPVFEALARGFLAGGGGGLSPTERALLVAGALVIVYEQAVRFLTDHIDGDRYYRISRPSQNLERARAQLRLLELLEAARPELERLVAAAGAAAAPVRTG